VEISIEEAKQLREQGRFDEAVAMLKQVIDLNIDDAAAYLELGLVYFDRRDYAQARKVLRVGMGLDPSCGGNVRCKGSCDRRRPPSEGQLALDSDTRCAAKALTATKGGADSAPGWGERARLRERMD
jgi:tetratricopeptide (TPR) repeat protein